MQSTRRRIGFGRTMLVIAMACMTIPAFAQTQSNGQEQDQARGQMRGMGMMSQEQFQENLTQMIAKLELDEDTAGSFSRILTEQHEKRMEMMSAMRQGGADMRSQMGQMREKMQTMESETMKALGDVLTEDELEMYKKIRSEQMPQRRRGGT